MQVLTKSEINLAIITHSMSETLYPTTITIISLLF